MRIVLATVVMLTTVSLSIAQSPAQGLQFDVASVKRNASGDAAASFRGDPGGRLAVTNTTLYNIVRNAYNAQRFQIVPGERTPDWFDRDRWDIIAKASEGNTTPAQVMVMLQNLLVARFKLAVKYETREMPVYALVLAKAERGLGP